MQLAVVAHIRHVYTDYDKLLKQGDYLLARSTVEQGTLDKLLTWRRDDDDDPNAMEGILREVIVIPDEDEDDASQDLNFPESVRSDREDSVEVVSDHEIADEVHQKPVEYGKMRNHTDPNRAYSPDMDTGGSFRYVRNDQASYKQQPHYSHERVDRMGSYRNRIWEEALHRRRKDPGPFYPTENRLVVHEAARSNQRILDENQAEFRSRWPESKAIQPHLVEYVGKALAREQSSHCALPLNGNHVEASYSINHSREQPKEMYDAPGQVSEIHSPTMVAQVPVAESTSRNTTFNSLRNCRYLIQCSNRLVL